MVFRRIDGPLGLVYEYLRVGSHDIGGDDQDQAKHHWGSFKRATTHDRKYNAIANCLLYGGRTLKLDDDDIRHLTKPNAFASEKIDL